MTKDKPFFRLAEESFCTHSPGPLGYLILAICACSATFPTFHWPPRTS